VFQRFNLLPALTALDNVLVPLIPQSVEFDKEQRARELLAAVGIADTERAIPSRMSGGQQQRVAIARALIGRPRLLLADEPTGNLDSRTGQEIIELLLRLRDEFGMTIVLATHDPQIARRCDRHVQLEDGRVVAD
jgi:putative ABC transport system ATP-binding protein